MPTDPHADVHGGLPEGWDPVMLETYLTVETADPGEDLRLEARRRVVDRNRIVIGIGPSGSPYVDLSSPAGGDRASARTGRRPASDL